MKSRDVRNHDASMARLTLLVGSTVVAFAGILYFFTAARDIVVGDSPELITAAKTLGVPHAPGYPLFTMLGHLFALFPFGSVPFRVNVLSLVFDSLTVGMVFLTAFRLGGSRVAAVMAALVLALNAVFWRWSLVAEVFPLNNFLASLLIYLLVLWHEQPERTSPLVLAAFTAGLAFSNHHTIVLLAPAILFIVWRHRWVLWARPRTIVQAVSAFVVGLLPYGYILWAAARHPIYNWGNISSFGDLLGLITRQSYGTQNLVATPYQGGLMWPRIAALCSSFGMLMGFFAIAGMIRAYRQYRSYFWFSMLAFGFTGLFFAVISNFNLESAKGAEWVLERFFLLPQVAAAPLIALGILMFADLVGCSLPAWGAKSLPTLAAAIGLVLAVSLVRNYQQVDQSSNHVARNFGEDLLSSLEPGTILFAGGDPYLIPLIYLTIAEKMRPDVMLIETPLLTDRWYIKQLRIRYPNLEIPFEAYDRQRNNNLAALIEANLGRPVALVGPPPDQSAVRDYWLRPHGLVQLVEPNSKWISADEWANENKELMRRYRPPASKTIKANTFESAILFRYSFAAWRIGAEYERGGSKAKAQEWYQRGLRIDPESGATYREMLRNNGPLPTSL